VPTAMMWSLISWQAACTLGTVGFVWWFVIRPYRKHGSLSFDGMFCLAGALLYWQDYGIVWAGPISSYNSGLLNWGSWYNFLPGWMPSTGRSFAEAPGYAGGFYTWGILGIAMIANFFMRKAKERWPDMSKLKVILVALVVAMYLDLCIEMLWMYSGLYHYSGLPGPKLFAGHYYQFPLLETLFWGLGCTAFASFRYFRNDKGETIVEHGIEEVHLQKRGKFWTRMLALFGGLSTIFLCYNLVWTLVGGLHPQQWPADTLKRSYFTQTQCGASSDRLCPNPDLPIFSGKVTILPDGTLGHPQAIPGNVPQTKCLDSPLDAPRAGDC
jgi:hypothetical protein